MDPATALGLARGIITFVDFTSKLISTGGDIFLSDEGTSVENLRVEEVYEKLLALNLQLEIPTVPHGLNATPQYLERSSATLAALRDLSASCKDDCRELLNVVRGLKVQNGHRKLWRSIKAAFRGTLESKTISGIEARLDRAQRVISLHVGAILSAQVSELGASLNELRIVTRQLKVEQMSKMDFISSKLSDLKLEAERAKATPPSNASEKMLRADQTCRALVPILSP